MKAGRACPFRALLERPLMEWPKRVDAGSEEVQDAGSTPAESTIRPGYGVKLRPGGGMAGHRPTGGNQCGQLDGDRGQSHALVQVGSTPTPAPKRQQGGAHAPKANLQAHHHAPTLPQPPNPTAPPVTVPTPTLHTRLARQ